ncbi:MAG: deoxyribose-phosphate aldolase [Actinomycetota bacterium]|nr:deoxyribose-phosphate aldolase [Actinomycetota bacterium]MDK1102803.1 deoxyribose-phosphate aldolase [Actinomycetota bacterium]
MENVLTVADVTYEQVAKMIDHSLLRPELTIDDVLEGCAVAAKYRVASATVRPADIVLSVDALSGSGVPVSTVVGFPHGSSATDTKVYEAKRCMDDGAIELDMVINIGRLLSGDVAYVTDDIAAVVAAAGADAIVKVIFENAYLNDEQKIAACKASEDAGAAFVKTSTGFAPSGATMHDLILMRSSVSPHVKVKAAGGIRTLDGLLEVMSIGVERIGATRTEAMLEDYKARSSS